MQGFPPKAQCKLPLIQWVHPEPDDCAHLLSGVPSFNKNSMQQQSLLISLLLINLLKAVKRD